jgi:hypothetical protein
MRSVAESGCDLFIGGVAATCLCYARLGVQRVKIKGNLVSLSGGMRAGKFQ